MRILLFLVLLTTALPAYAAGEGLAETGKAWRAALQRTQDQLEKQRPPPLPVGPVLHKGSLPNKEAHQ